MNRLAKLIVDLVTRRGTRECDVPIGDKDDIYLERWFVIPRNHTFNIYLHHIIKDDDDRAMHDHVANNVSIILTGGYDELMFAEPPVAGRPLPKMVKHGRRAGDVIFRKADVAHRLMRRPDMPGEVWTLFIKFGDWRQWGFWCPLGRWVHWKEFTGIQDGSGKAYGTMVSNGCGD